MALRLIWLLAPILEYAVAAYTVPSTAPSDATALDPSPVGISFEFFTFPSYFTNVTSTNQCLKNFQQLTGRWPPIRIGGTTGDRASYDSASSAYVVYTVSSPLDAPETLTFGPSFLSLAATYSGSVVLGLNRGQDDISNTIAAAKVAKSKMNNLLAIELGNEPDFYSGDAIAKKTGSWSPAIDAQSQENWITQVGSALGEESIFQAGNWFGDPPTWGAVEMLNTANATVKSYIHDFAHHQYPGGSAQSLMTHSNVVSFISTFKADIAAVNALGKDYVLGETNSVAGGGASTVSPTFAAGLWTMDHLLRASLLNIKRSYYHHGTIGKCYYCWWDRSAMAAPYWGAYAAVATMATGAYISALDTGTTNYAVYVVYDSSRAPLRVLLYNSDYYAGAGTRSTQSFSLNGLGVTSVKAKRLTAANAESTGSAPTFGGQGFGDGTCTISGAEKFETTSVTSGAATFSVAASEALLLYLR